MWKHTRMEKSMSDTSSLSIIQSAAETGEREYKNSHARTDVARRRRPPRPSYRRPCAHPLGDRLARGRPRVVGPSASPLAVSSGVRRAGRGRAYSKRERRCAHGHVPPQREAPGGTAGDTPRASAVLLLEPAEEGIGS